MSAAPASSGGSSLGPIPEDAIWIATNGSDSTGNGSSASPYLTFDKARQVATAGKTIVYKDGTYTGATQRLGGTGMQPPSGTSTANRTIVRAQTPGQVTIDMAGAYYGAYITTGTNYVHVDGFRFINGAEFCGAFDGDYLKVTNSFFGNADNGNYALQLSVNGNYNLIEDCWWCGRGRGTIIYGTGHTLRRCVCRHDYYTGDQGFLAYVVYDGTDTMFENCIAIDIGTAATTFDWKGGFRSRDIYEARNHYMRGCIALNTQYDGYRIVCTDMENCIAWDVNGRGGIYEDNFYTTRTIKNCTVGATANGGINLGGSTVHSCLHVDVTGGNTSGDRNHYDNTSSPGGTNVTTGDSGLLYLPRIEAGSACKGTGQSGSDRGANVLYRYVDGVLTDQALWPWPNEDRIKSDFQTDFGLSGVTPARGFAANGNDAWGQPHSLTRYIWQYLGNQIPSGIY